MTTSTMDTTGGGAGTSDPTTMDAGSNAGFGNMITGIGDMVDGALDGWWTREGDRRQALADDPCRLSVDIITYRRDFIDPAITRASQAAIALSTQGARAVWRSLDNWGRPDPRYVGGTTFVRYAVSNNYLSMPSAAGALALLFGGPVGPAAAAAAWEGFLADHLGPDAPPLGNPPGNKAFRVSPGVYLYAGGGIPKGDARHITDGELRGSRVRSAWYSWREAQRRDVSPAHATNWRNRLTRLVGSGNGSWRVWEDGDPISANSKLGQLHTVLAMLLDEKATADARCAAGNFPGSGNNGGNLPTTTGGGGGATSDNGWMMWLLLGFLFWMWRQRR